MGTFSGSYRSQMADSLDKRAFTMEMEDAAASDLSQYEGFLEKEVPAMSDAESLFGEYGSFLESSFEMGGGEAAGTAALAETAADATALALGAELAIPAAAIGMVMFMEYASVPNNFISGTYNPGAGWSLRCTAGPPAPAQNQHKVVGNGFDLLCGNSVKAGSYVAAWGTALPAGLTDWNEVWSTQPPPNNQGFTTQSWLWTGGGSSTAPPYSPGRGAARFGAMDKPWSVSQPLGGGDDDIDRPHNVFWRHASWGWRLGDVTPRPFAQGEPVPPGKPPGGSSGGGGGSGGWGPQAPPLPTVIRYGYPAPENVKSPAATIKYRNGVAQPPEEDEHYWVIDNAIKIEVPKDVFEAMAMYKSPKGVDGFFKTLAKSVKDHPCSGLDGEALASCVLKNWDRINWKHAAGQFVRDAVKSEHEGKIVTQIPYKKPLVKRVWRVVRPVHNALALAQKRNRFYDRNLKPRKGMF